MIEFCSVISSNWCWQAQYVAAMKMKIPMDPGIINTQGLVKVEGWDGDGPTAPIMTLSTT